MYNSAANARMKVAPVRYLLVSNAGQIVVCIIIKLLLCMVLYQVS